MDKDCGTILLEFIQNIPITRRSWLASRLHILTLNGGGERNCNYMKDLENALTNKESRIKNTILIAAAMDHALIKFGPDPDEVLPQLAAKHDGAFDQKAAASHLQTRHLNQIRKDWMHLRATSMQPILVREFEHKSLNSYQIPTLPSR